MAWAALPGRFKGVGYLMMSHHSALCFPFCLWHCLSTLEVTPLRAHFLLCILILGGSVSLRVYMYVCLYVGTHMCTCIGGESHLRCCCGGIGSLSLAWCSPVWPAWLASKPQRPVSASLALGSQVCISMLDFLFCFGVCFFVCLRYSFTCWLKTYCNLPASVFRVLGLRVLYFLVLFLFTKAYFWKILPIKNNTHWN